MKYYVVKVGKTPGIYETWEECQSQVINFKGAIYKSFSNLEEAKAYYLGEEVKKEYHTPVCYIDGSYDAKTMRYSFGGILLYNGQKIQFKKAYPADEFSKYRNVAGEIKGAAYIMNYCYKQQIKELLICYDYLGIEKWYDGSWQAKTDISKLYVNFLQTIKGKLKVSFQKIKSHTGNEYNEMADKLAKEALGI